MELGVELELSNDFISLDSLELPAVGQKDENGDIHIQIYRENTVTSSFLTLGQNTRGEKNNQKLFSTYLKIFYFFLVTPFLKAVFYS